MIDNRELVITFRQIHNKDETFSHWEAIITFNEEQIYEETATDLPSAGAKIYPNIWDDNSVVPDTYRFKEVPNPLLEKQDD